MRKVNVSFIMFRFFAHFFKFSVLSFVLLPNIAFSSNCHEKRFAFDIGSGSTKSKSYLVDKCENKIIKQIGEFNRHVRYQECISNSADKKTITKECLAEGYKAIKAIEKSYGIDCHKERCSGVATAWARNAKNFNELLGLFRAENIFIQMISQTEEGELGFRTAANDPELKGTSPEKIVVWDIGGGSYQFSMLTDSNKVEVEDGPFGILNFFQDVREAFPKAGHPVEKERYFGSDELPRVLEFSSNKVKKIAATDLLLQKKLKEKDVKVVGIGRIMYLGIKHQLEAKNPVSKTKIRELIYDFADKSAEEVKAKYPKLPDYFITLAQQSLILVYAVMDAYRIDQIEIVDSTMTDQIVVDPKLWESKVNSEISRR